MLHDTLLRHAEQRPGKEALRALDGRAISYGELPHRLGAVQRWVAGVGVPYGQVLAVAMSNGADAVLTLLGASLHATLSPLDPDLGPAEIRSMLEQVGAKGILTDVAHAGRLSALAAELGVPLFIPPFQGSGDLGTLSGGANGGFIAPTPDHVLLLHRTSGTTGTSKRVPLRANNIGIQARNTADSLNLTDQDRIVNVMPIFHMHGFGCLSGTLWSGGTVICTPGHDGKHYAEWVRTHKPTWFSASPTILHDITRAHRQDPLLKEEAPYRFIRSLSAAIPFGLAEEIERATVAPLVEQYGLTEALSPVIANHPPPGSRKLGSIGKAYRTEVRIMDQEGREVLNGEVGEITLKGPGVIEAYAETPELNAKAWFGDHFRTGDLGYRDDDGRIYITGRSKEEINRGGEKISPYEVEAALAGHPGVKVAAAFAVPHPTLGDEVALAYVPVGAPVGSEELRRWMLGRIAAFKAPKKYFVVDELPTTATGKVKRYALAGLLNDGSPIEIAEANGATTMEPYERAVAQALAAGPLLGVDPEVLPADYVQRTVALVWGQELGLERVLLTDDFFLLGGDSLSGVRICGRLCDMLGCQVKLVDLFRNPKLKDFAVELGRTETTRRWTNLAPIRSTGSRLPFVCVHGDEGNYNIPRLLNEDRPFLGFMHQGEDGLGMKHQTIRSIARHYANELLDARPDGPYILSGFSMGGVIAFEMARRLVSLGKEVPLLVLLDARGPDFNWWRYAPRTKLADLRGDLLRPRCDRYLDRGQPIPFKLRNFYIINTYRRALERYQPKPYSGKVLLVRSRQRANEPAGWQNLLLGDVHTRVLPGEHLTILREPHVRAVVAAVEEYLRGSGM
ncbi:MAG: AMP-binding protein [Flavobacteriales bacterium]|nr:AMP-binding protein [Flavobacteriales bacterium]